MSRNNLLGLILVGAAALLAGLYIGGGLPSGGTGMVPDTGGTTAQGEECPHTWEWTADEKLNIEEFTGGRDDVPEYNDCQRFLVGSATAPVYTNAPFAIFISDSVAAAASGGPATTPTTDKADTSAVALVRALGTYDQLGMPKAGFYCLLMIRNRGAWSGAMAPAGSNANCAKPETSPVHALFVHRIVKNPNGSDFAAGDVPGVARWGFDGVPGKGIGGGSWVQYAIVPCDGGTCYVGPTRTGGSGAGFTPKPPNAVLAGMSPNLPTSGKVREIDGWHDTQFLAAPVAGSGGTKPASPPVVGVLIPDPELATRTVDDFKQDWTSVAEVAMSAQSDYAKKFSFAETTGSAYNTIEACYYEGTGSTGNCTGLPADLDKRCALTDKYPGHWRTRHITAAKTDTTYHCVDVTKMNDQSLVLPGTTRWKWLKNDETAWFRCPGGCCKVVN